MESKEKCEEVITKFNGFYLPGLYNLKILFSGHFVYVIYKMATIFNAALFAN